MMEGETDEKIYIFVLGSLLHNSFVLFAVNVNAQRPPLFLHKKKPQN